MSKALGGVFQASYKAMPGGKWNSATGAILGGPAGHEKTITSGDQRNATD